MMFVLRLYFKKVSFSNKSNYPSSGPVILAAMHPNSFIDDMTLGAFTKRQLTFLARGDVFNSKFKRFLLGQMFVSPIYRAMDNVKDVKKNIEALDMYSQKLRRGKVILIHSEGICVVEKRVRKMRKGTARIAFGAEEQSDFKLGVKVVPVSMNYSNAPKIRERVMIDFGEPIELKKYEALYKENSAKAMLEFNNELYAALVSKSIHVKPKEADKVADVCLEITVNDKPPKALPIYDEDEAHLTAEKKVSDRINHLFENENEQYKNLEQLTNQYSSALQANNLNDASVVKSKNGVLKSIALALLLPLYSLAYILNVLPVFLGRRLADKVVKTPEFYGSVYVGASWMLGLLYYLLIIILVNVLSPFSGCLVVFCMAFTGFWSVLLRDQYLSYLSKSRASKVFNQVPQLQNELLSLREQIKQILA